MSYEVENQISFKLLFNGWEFPFERANSLGFLHMSSGTTIHVPMVHLTLQDNSEVMTQSDRLNEGALIQIVIQARGESGSNTYSFRKNSMKRVPNDGAYNYQIDGYFDSVKYWQESVADPITATSHGVIQQIATECGLKYDGVATTDSQVWWPRNKRYHSWANHISDHGYRSDTSCMQLALNLDGTLVYKDITDLRQSVVKMNFGEYKQGEFLIADAVPILSAGTPNHFTGYADQIIEQNPLGEAFNKITKDLTVKKKSREGSMLMSAHVKKNIQQANISFGPINPGNAHAEHVKALYQNKRLRGLFSSGLDVLTPQNTNLKILDSVTVNMEQASGYLKEFSGQYIVGSRSLYIQGAEYFERLSLKRRTVNTRLNDSIG